MSERVVLLYSGGFDSTALLYVLVKIYNILPNDIYCININYKQKNIPEIITAEYHTAKLGTHYQYLDISFLTDTIFKSSALVNKNKKVDTELDKDKQPNSYVPNRNLLFLSIALSYAENIDAHKVYTAIQPHEKYFYWDATSLFVATLNEVISLNPFGIKIEAPFSEMSKKDIYEFAKKNCFDKELEYTWSCYEPIIEEYDDKIIYKPCNKCGACQERNKVLKQNEIVIYKS